MEGIEAVLPVLLAFVSLGAFELGTRVRGHIHVVMPHRDPVTLILVLLCLSPAIASYLGEPFIDPTNIWYIAFVIAFLSCYTLAYVRGELGLVYVNIHTIVSDQYPNGCESIKPVVYYWDRDGNMCLQEQTYKEVLKSMIGVRSPLRLDVGMIRRTRPVIVQKVLYPKVSVSPIDVVEERISETTVKKGLITYRVRSYQYVPAPQCIDTTQDWLVSAYNQQKLTTELTRKESQILEMQMEMQSSQYARTSDLLMEMTYDKTPGAEIYRTVASRLSPETDDDAPDAKDVRNAERDENERRIRGRRKA